MKKFLKGLMRFLGVVVVLVILGGVVLYFTQDFFLFPGHGIYTGKTPEWQSRIASVGTRGYVPVDFAGPDAGTVKGLWAPNPGGVAPAILWFHSRDQNITEINQHLKPLVAAGLHVFAMEYRGYGDSPGKTTEAGLLADASASLEWVEKRDDVGGKRIFVGGIEIGGNLALKVAARNSVTGVIVVSPLPNMSTAVARKIPLFPVDFLLKQKFELYPDLPAIAAPVFIAHGTADAVVPLFRVEAMVAALGTRTVTLREVEGAGHADVFEKGGKDLEESMDVFVSRAR